MPPRNALVQGWSCSSNDVRVNECFAISRLRGTGITSLQWLNPEIGRAFVPLTYEGRSADEIKGLVYCDGYHIVLFERRMTGGKADPVTVEWTPSRSLLLSGRIGGLERPVLLAVNYVAEWSRGFFGLLNGAPETFNVASVSVSESGAFALTVPDLAKDPVVRVRAQERGYLELTARDVTGGEYRLELAGQDGEPVRFRLADAYSPLRLVARPRGR